MTTISKRLRDLSKTLIGSDFDMLLPNDTIDPDEAADVIDALVAALEQTRRWLPVVPPGHPDVTDGCLKQIDAALALAKGKPRG